MCNDNEKNDWQPTSDLAKTVFQAGFLYDPTQNIIFSRCEAWQRKLGFTWAYDVACPPAFMIIDCEPIYFTYGGKDWMIELWKGQYGIETGGEIGVYNKPAVRPVVQAVNKVIDKHPRIKKVTQMVKNAPVINKTVTGLEKKAEFFACVPESEELLMEFTLKRNGGILFQRGPKPHWWLTGFKWGVFTEKTSDLVMDLAITFPKKEMLDAFRGGLNELGYKKVTINGEKIGFTFDKPATVQPIPRVKLEEKVQEGNKVLVQEYVALQNEQGLLKDDPQHSNDPNRFDESKITSDEGKKAYQAILDFGLLAKGKRLNAKHA